MPYADLSNPQSLNQYIYVLNNHWLIPMLMATVAILAALGKMFRILQPGLGRGFGQALALGLLDLLSLLIRSQTGLGKLSGQWQWESSGMM